jgi:protein kinase-like protein
MRRAMQGGDGGAERAEEAPPPGLETEPADDDSLVREVAAAPPISVPADVATLVLLEPGVVIDGAFRIDERLGAGGMGVVYAARDLKLQREVALKIMRLERSVGRRLPAIFQREAWATARLNHPNVVTLHQFGDWNGLVYLVLERLRGETLQARLDREPLPLEDGLAILEQVARALVHTHAASIVHRDLKPANVFLVAGGGVKVLDFGVSGLALRMTAAPAPAAPGQTAAPRSTLSRAGTPGYMAPEQWRGEAQDHRTDLWALGVMLYQLLGGGLPHGLGWLGALAPDARPQPLPASVPPALAALAERCLAVRPEDRPESAAVVADGLAAALAALRGDPDAARTRRRRRAIGLAAAGVAIAAAVAGWQLGAREAPPPAPVDLATVDLSGRWLFSRGRARLTRLAADRYRWECEGFAGDIPNRWVGELRVVQRDDQVLLQGPVADVPGFCCSNLGDFDGVVVRPDLLVITTRWRGPDSASYHTVLPAQQAVRDRSPSRPEDPLRPPSTDLDSAYLYPVVNLGAAGARSRPGVLIATNLVLTATRALDALAGNVTLRSSSGVSSWQRIGIDRDLHPWKPVALVQTDAPLEDGEVVGIDDREPAAFDRNRLFCSSLDASGLPLRLEADLTAVSGAEARMKTATSISFDAERDRGAPCYTHPGMLFGIVERVEAGEAILIRIAPLVGWMRSINALAVIRARAHPGLPGSEQTAARSAVSRGPLLLRLGADGRTGEALCLELDGGGVERYVPLVQAPCSGARHQRFFLDSAGADDRVRLDGGVSLEGYRVISDRSGVCLDDYSDLLATSRCSEDAERFVREPIDPARPDGAVRYRMAAPPNYCITAAGGAGRGLHGARAGLATCAPDGPVAALQSFREEPVDPVTPPLDPAPAPSAAGSP